MGEVRSDQKLGISSSLNTRLRLMGALVQSSVTLAPNRRGASRSLNSASAISKSSPTPALQISLTSLALWRVYPPRGSVAVSFVLQS